MIKLRKLIVNDMKVIMKTNALDQSVLFDGVLFEEEVQHLKNIMGTHKEATIELEVNNMLGKKP